MFFKNEGKHSIKRKKEDLTDSISLDNAVEQEDVIASQDDVVIDENAVQDAAHDSAAEEDSTAAENDALEDDVSGDGVAQEKDAEEDGAEAGRAKKGEAEEDEVKAAEDEASEEQKDGINNNDTTVTYTNAGIDDEKEDGLSKELKEDEDELYHKFAMPEDEQDLKAQPMVGGVVDAAAAALEDEILGVEQAVPVALAPSKNRHIAVRVIGIVIVVFAIAFIACIVALYIADSERIKYVPENTTLDSKINISHETREELKQEIASYFTDTSNTMEVSVDFAGDVRQIDLKNTGEIDSDAMVAAAFEPYDKAIVERMIDNVEEMFTGNVAARNVSVMIKPLTDKITEAVNSIAEEINTDPVDATYEYDKSENAAVPVEAKDGKNVNVEQTTSSIEQAIEQNNTKDPVSAVVDVTKPENTEVGQAIYVDTSACVLHFYQDGQETNKYACTPGMSGYSTPKGDWTLSYKDPSPTWYNPHSSWSESMPETIGPGASNPLGLRALALSCGGGIYIHGTTNTGQLGTRASHGCIRLANAKIVELYDMVNTGIPIFVR